MLKIYDTNKDFVALIDRCRNPCITTELKTGLKELSFGLPLTDENLSYAFEEYYVETDDYSYIIKEVNLSKNDYIHIYCKANIEELEFHLVPVFDAFDISVEKTIEKAVGGTGWKVEYHSNTKTMTEYKLAHMSSYELLELIKTDYDLEYFYDTKAKILKVYDYMGKEMGAYFSNELRLNMLARQGQSYDFATVLYPIGKDGITIGDINGGVNLIENYDYCGKYIPRYWIQDDIEYPQQLKMLAEAYLAYVSKPIVSYSLDLSSLPAGVGIGDTIIIVDKIKRVKDKQRVVKIVQYPFAPEKDKVEISNEIVNFANTFIKYKSDYQKQIEYIKKNLATLP